MIKKVPHWSRFQCYNSISLNFVSMMIISFMTSNISIESSYTHLSKNYTYIFDIDNKIYTVRDGASLNVVVSQDLSTQMSCTF